MTKTTIDILSLISSGAGVTLSSSRLTFDLVTIARAAKKSGTKVIIRGEKNTQEMILIAKAGEGFVTFELDS